MPCNGGISPKMLTIGQRFGDAIADADWFIAALQEE